MLPDREIGCHRLARKCRDGVANDGCQLWTNLKLRNPQSGEMVDKWGCADAFMPMLLLEIAAMSRQTSAAVESFRNETIKASDTATEERRQTLTQLGNRLGLT